MKLSVLDQSTVAEGRPPAEALHNTLELARLADRLGYERYWVAEHHGIPSHAGTAPEILVARIAAETTGIRVGSGGVLLTYYSPMKVAEVFHVLQAMYPGRIDLGIGRAGGANPLENRAMRWDAPAAADDFDARVSALQRHLHESFAADHPYSTIKVMPTVPDVPPVWLLGSSVRSAAAAAELGLPYAYAHFINPADTRKAVETYRARFRGPEPRVIVGLGMYCGETDAQAQRMLASHLLVRKRLFAGDIRAIPDADEAVAELARGPHPLAGEQTEWPRYFAGTPERIRHLAGSLEEELGVDELIAMNMIHDHADRLRCYELLAEALGLVPRADPAVLQ
ncbi:LLM class flavin-dependent oxidoreductase [Streptomyces sp. NPDC014983]|uniref:LLM class flavin-dependent oxidoreductase n=1 Tax=Streptomyces sp. NPDC014983 TaxID=3364933 RepID=UPI0037002910